MSQKPPVLSLTNGKAKSKAKQQKESNFKDEDYDYLYQVKVLFEDVGIETKPGAEETNASIMSLFFNKVSGWAKGDVTTDIDFGDANDVMAAFNKWKISKSDQSIGLVIYRSMSEL